MPTELARFPGEERTTDPVTGQVTAQAFEWVHYLDAPKARVDGATTVVVTAAAALARARAAKKAAIEVKREAVIGGGVPVPSLGKTVNSDLLSITRNIPSLVQDATLTNVSALQAADSGGSPPAAWSTTFRFADDTMATITGSDMIAIGQAVKSHVNAAYARSWVLKAAVDAAANVAAVEAIAIAGGWPG